MFAYLDHDEEPGSVATEGKTGHPISSRQPDTPGAQPPVWKALAQAMASLPRDALWHNLSHELRTPLTAILGFADMLMRRCEDDESAGAAKTIQRNGRRLLHVVDGMLHFLKTNSGDGPGRPGHGAPPLPAATPSGPSSGANAALKLPPGCRVLLVEDNADLQRLISLMLQLAGADVTTASDGAEALKVLSAAPAACEPFDVVLMDIQMPVMDGWEATRELRRRGYTRPIVALTAYAMFGDREICLDAGCDDYATKPIERPALIALVARRAAVARAG